MSWSKAQRRAADRSAQRSINALVGERAAHYLALFSKKIERTPQSWSPTPLNTEVASLPVTPPPIPVPFPLVTTIYPVPVRPWTTAPQTTGDDMQAIENTDKRPEKQPLNETTKQPDGNLTSIENIVAAAVIAYQKTHERRNPPYVEICAFAQTILEIRGYARDSHILKTQHGDLSSIKVRVNKKLNADQVVCGETEECGE